MMAKQSEQAQSRELAPIDRMAPARLPITPGLMANIGVNEAQWTTLTDQVFPSARSVEAIALALRYCAVRNLDIYKRPVHIVPMWSSTLRRYVETVWPGISELRTTAHRTGQFAGIEQASFGPAIEREFIDKIDDDRDPRNGREIKRMLIYPEFCDINVFRNVAGVRCGFHARVYWTEAYATASRNSEMPNEMWRKRPFGQLEKCAEAAALRRAFPEEIGNDYSAEEMAGRIIEHDADENITSHVADAGLRPRPPRPPENGKPAEARNDAMRHTGLATDKIEDAVVEEIRPGKPPTDSRDPRQEADADQAYLDDLRQRLAEAPDEKTLDIIWEEFDPMAHFEGDEKAQAEANNIREFRLKILRR